VEPDPALLSTAVAKRPETIVWAREPQAECFTRLEVLGMYATNEEIDGAH
jgi:hypothetical protein